MPRDKRDIEAALTGKGFTRRESDSHDFVYMTLQGQKSRAHNKPSHTPKRKEIGDGLLGHGLAMRTDQAGVPGSGGLPLEPRGL